MFLLQSVCNSLKKVNDVRLIDQKFDLPQKQVELQNGHRFQF